MFVKSYICKMIWLKGGQLVHCIDKHSPFNIRNNILAYHKYRSENAPIGIIEKKSFIKQVVFDVMKTKLLNITDSYFMFVMQDSQKYGSKWTLICPDNDVLKTAHPASFIRCILTPSNKFIEHLCFIFFRLKFLITGFWKCTGSGLCPQNMLWCMTYNETGNLHIIYFFK